MPKELYNEVRMQFRYRGIKFLGSYKRRSCRCQNPNFHLYINLELAGISQFGAVHIVPPVILVDRDNEILTHHMFGVSTGTRLLASSSPPHPTPTQFKVHTLFARSLSSPRWKTLQSLLDSLLSQAYLAEKVREFLDIVKHT